MKTKPKQNYIVEVPARGRRKYFVTGATSQADALRRAKRFAVGGLAAELSAEPLGDQLEQLHWSQAKAEVGE